MNSRYLSRQRDSLPKMTEQTDPFASSVDTPTRSMDACHLVRGICHSFTDVQLLQATEFHQSLLSQGTFC